MVPSDGRVCWEVDGAEILSANADSSELTVVWNTPGNYEVIATAINHLDAVSVPTSVQIEVYPLPMVTITNNNGTLEASGGYPYYQWYLNGVSINGANGASIVPIVNGSYTVEVLSVDGCLSVSEELALVGLHQYGHSNVKVAYVKVYDITGRVLYRSSWDDWKQSSFGSVLRPTIVEHYTTDGQFIKAELQVVKPTF